jgi:hypothetical protein
MRCFQAGQGNEPRSTQDHVWQPPEDQPPIFQ